MLEMLSLFPEVMVKPTPNHPRKESGFRNEDVPHPTAPVSVQSGKCLNIYIDTYPRRVSHMQEFIHEPFYAENL